MADGRFAMTIPSDTAAGMEAQQRILGRLEALGFAGRDLTHMQLALEEAIINAIKHGNREDEDKVVKIVCDLGPDRAKVVIRDQGEGFDPEDVPDPTAEENLDKASGRGILLMRSFMTELSYADGGRQLTLVKDRTTE